jgi:hypothetical protein
MTEEKRPAKQDMRGIDFTKLALKYPDGTQICVYAELC